MKYYLYISDAKVDMLIQQIPHNVKKNIGPELKFDLKILSASRKTEVVSADDRIGRLEAVCEFIQQFGNVGTVEEPQEYLADVLDMTWETYGLKDGNERDRLVYFAGVSKRNVLGLAGSVIHLVGRPTPSRELLFTIGGGSEFPYILRFLHEVLSGERHGNSFLYGNESPEQTWIEDTYRFSHRLMDGPKQRLEFLAKRLLNKKCKPQARTTRQKGVWNVV